METTGRTIPHAYVNQVCTWKQILKNTQKKNYRVRVICSVIYIRYVCRGFKGTSTLRVVDKRRPQTWHQQNMR